MNSPPTITAVRSDQEAYFEPGPIPLTVGEGTLNFTLLDTDINDKLFVRMFVEYTVDSPTAARSTCTAAPVENVRRTVTCDVRAVCLPADATRPADKPLPMSILVFDREPLETGDPPFQAMPDGGLSTSRFFFLTCSLAS